VAQATKIVGGVAAQLNQYPWQVTNERIFAIKWKFAQLQQNHTYNHIQNIVQQFPFVATS
jgi:hypothetical protein